MGNAVTFRNLDLGSYFLLFSWLIFPNDRRAKRLSMQCCCDARIECEKNLRKVPFLACERI